MSTQIFKKFDSIKSFNDYLNKGTVQPNFTGAEYSKTKELDGSWYKTSDYKQATDLLLFGDKELQKKIEAAGVSDVRTNIYKNMTRKQMYSSVVGAAPNVPAYISGAPNSMIAIRQTKVRQKVVNVAYNCAVYGGTSVDSIINSCAKLISALMLIEAKGVRINLYAVDFDTEPGEYVSFAIKIKSAGQHFDTLKMSYPMAHPSMNRRHKFRFTEITEGVSRYFRTGYGHPESDTEKTLKHFSEHGLKLDACFCNETLTGRSVEEIVKSILGQ